MKTIKTEIELYQYDELEEEPRERAFNDHFTFLCSIEEDGGTEEEISQDVEESIRANEYWFFKDGKLAYCITYTGKHEKAGTTEFKFQDKVYQI